MTTLASAVRTAIEQTVAAVTPTRYRDVPNFYTLEDDGQPGEVAVTSGMERCFIVEMGDAEEGPYQHPAEGEMRQRFIVGVLYPCQADMRDLEDVISDDIHDIRIALNNFESWRSRLTTPTDLLHAAVPQVPIRPIPDEGNDRVIALIPLDVQFLEAR